MKAKNIALAILFIGILGAGIWWLNRPAEIAPINAAQTPVLPKAVTPPTAAIEMPKLPPVATASTSTVAATPEKAPEKPHLYVPPGGVTDIGTIEFKEGVPVTVTLDSGIQCILTAQYFPTPGSISEKMTINVEPLEPGTQTKIEKAATTNLVQNGKHAMVLVGDAELKYTPVMKTN